jgi:hypothetical protein
VLAGFDPQWPDLKMQWPNSPLSTHPMSAGKSETIRSETLSGIRTDIHSRLPSSALSMAIR